jgi:serine/threonine protein kinase
MNDDQVAWVDCPKWRDRWVVIENLPGGGQGEAFRASRKVDGRIAFLKVIKGKSDPERRARFSREANAYDTFRVDGVPTLIESNAQRHRDAEVEPYIATEFIEGPTLRQWREKLTRVDLAVAVGTTRSLLRTLHGCHAAGCVHRDIKPDNIILTNADPDRAALLDFGLNFHDTSGISFQTEHGQEIGNRFLRLPELSAGSLLKQDPRSDLSFAAGILFYMLTGTHPDLLQDAEGRLPHQRRQSAAILNDLAGVRYARVASLFDSAFAPRIADRFTSANAMLANIDRMMADPDVGRSPDHDLAAILEVVDTEAGRRRLQTIKRLREALEQVQRVHRDVERSLNGAFGLLQTGLSVDGEVGRNTLLWQKAGSNDTVMSTTYEAREAGDEIVIRMAGETVFRTPIDLPSYGGDFQQTVRAWLLARIRAAVSDPDALPPESDNFGEFRPLARLVDAVDEACRTGRRILAFVYDPTQKERGRLQHGLSYFLQNRKTREAIHDAFVVALVPISQVAAKSNALQGLSMESSHWVVFDTNLTPLEQAVIYANPQEGERIALDLARRFGSV